MKAFVLGNYMHAHFVHVARLPAAGESLAARRVVAEHGGKGLNLALGLHRLGIEVALLMAVGRDASGAAVRLALQGEGVCTEGIVELGEQSGFGVLHCTGRWQLSGGAPRCQCAALGRPRRGHACRDRDGGLGAGHVRAG